MKSDDKLDHIINELSLIKQDIQKYHGLDLKESLSTIYEVVQDAQKEIGFPKVEQITKYLFDMIQHTPTRGVYISTSLTQISDDNKLWFLSANYAEQLNEIEVDDLLDKKLSVVGSGVRIRILDLLSTRSLGFGEIKQEIVLLDGALNHHLKLLIEVNFVSKKKKIYSLTSQGLQVLWFAKSIRIEIDKEKKNERKENRQYPNITRMN